MEKSQDKPDFSQIVETVRDKFIRYRLVIFVVFVALIYGYVFWKINTYAGAKPSALAISNQEHIGPSIQRIDPATVQKIEQLKDNSVNVQALFNQSRNNPFAD